MKRSHWNYSITPPEGGEARVYDVAQEWNSREQVRRIARVKAMGSPPGTVVMLRRDGRDQEGWYTQGERRLSMVHVATRPRP